MRRISILVPLVAILLSTALPGAKADHLNLIGRTLDCGSAGTFTIEGTVPAPEGVPGQAPPVVSAFLLAETSSVLVPLHVERDGRVTVTTPGIFKSNVSLVTCTILVVEEGFTYKFIGILTPAAG